MRKKKKLTFKTNNNFFFNFQIKEVKLVILLFIYLFEERERNLFYNLK